mgnify:CR=1 FL=1
MAEPIIKIYRGMIPKEEMAAKPITIEKIITVGSARFRQVFTEDGTVVSMERI